MTDTIDIVTPDGRFHAYRALPKATSAPAAELANGRTREFLKAHLG